MVLEIPLSIILQLQWCYVNMKKKVFLLLFLILLTNVYSQSKKAQKYFNQANKIFENSNLSEWRQSSLKRDKAIQKLDKAIEIEPDWWIPYREKIQILKIGSLQNNAQAIVDVYNLWLKNGNSLEGFSKFSYACSLFCCNQEERSVKMFEKLFSDYDYSKKNLAEDEKIIFIFSGIILGKFSEKNLNDITIELFDSSMITNLKDFLLQFNENKKESLWSYVG